MNARIVCAIGIMFILALAWPTKADEPTARELELAELAKTIAKILQGRDVDTVKLGAFRCTRDPQISHGAGICRVLARELVSLGVKVEAKATHVVEGDYDDKIDPKSRRVYIELACRVIERRDGKSNVTLIRKRGLFGEQALIEFLTPAAVVLDPAATPQEREEAFVSQNDSDKPVVHLQGTKIFANAKEVYGVEVLVEKGAGYEAKTPVLKSGQLYVPLTKDQPFAIRLLNNSALNAAATINIDGLDVFCFSDALRKGGSAPRWFVPKRTSSDVDGWPIRAGLSYKFQVTEYAKSAVAELNAAGNNVGVITVTFAAAWPKGSRPPDEENARNALAVGKGAPIDRPFQTVSMAFGATRAILNIRYQR